MASQRGVSLIEAMVSMVVFALGLLGISGLVMSSMSSQGVSQNRNQATLLAVDMADRMRANLVAVNTLPAVSYLTAANTSDTYAKAMAATLTATAPGVCITGIVCAPAAIAASDLVDWQLAINRALPSGAGILRLPPAGGEPGERQIVIMWTAKNAGGSDAAMSLQDNINCPPTAGVGAITRTAAELPTVRCVTLRFVP